MKQSLNTKIITFHGLLIKLFKHVQQAQEVPSNEKESNNENKHRLLLPFQGDKGCNIIKSINKRVNKLLPNNTMIEVAFKSTKLSGCRDMLL